MVNMRSSGFVQFQKVSIQFKKRKKKIMFSPIAVLLLSVLEHDYSKHFDQK